MNINLKYLRDENGEIFSPIANSAGIIMKDNTTLQQNLYPVIHINRKVNITEENVWTDVGIDGSVFYHLNLQNKSIIKYGAYAMLLNINPISGTDGDGNYLGKANIYDESGIGIISGYSGNTNSGNDNEIPMSWNGHAPNNALMKLRWLRVSGSKSPKLQISCNKSWNVECNLNFYFRKLI